MKAVYTLCSDPVAAERAFEDLRGIGVAEEDIVVCTPTPVEQFEFGRRDQVTWLPWISVAGGVVGFLSGAALVGSTQLAWPLTTGGMPIVPLWTDLIPVFELTMLFAVLATVGGLIVTARLFRRLPSIYDPEVSQGRILIGVVQPSPGLLNDIERALGTNGELRRV